MRKVVVILLCFFLCVQCSVSRKADISGELTKEGASGEYIIGVVRKQNITNNSFNITKAEIEIVTAGGTEKLISSIKFERPGTYLISLRSKIGIEVLRIFITEDTILANDRINRKLYFGSSDYLKKKYNLPVAVIPLVLGDFISNARYPDSSFQCVEGKVIKDYSIDNMNIRYVIGCKKAKVLTCEVKTPKGRNVVDIVYDKFFKEGNALIPGRIKINEYEDSLTINVRILKYKSSDEDKIQFIPGSKYELIRLL